MGKFVFCDIKDAAMHTAGKKVAELSFSDGFTGACQISKGFPDRPDKGFEQLKRWISCASFESIVLKDLELSRLGKARDSFLVWIKDHSSSLISLASFSHLTARIRSWRLLWGSNTGQMASISECFFSILATIPDPEKTSAHTIFGLPSFFEIISTSSSIFPIKLLLFPR